MTQVATRTTVLDVVEAGPLAADRLATDSTGRITARFATSCYADFDGRLLCLGGPGLPLGPINIRIAGLPAGLTVGDAVTIETGGLEIWQPPYIGSWSRRSREAGLRTLRDIVSTIPADTGLTGLVFGRGMPSGLPAFAERAQAAIGDLRLWLEAPDDGADELERGTCALLGLGPGLTPSGDDFLVGMLVALSEMSGMEDCALQAGLSENVRRLAPIRTSQISTAHLLAACDGLASDALHRAVQTILCNTPALADDLTALAAIGHSSGWDALAGAVIVLDTFHLSGSPSVCYVPTKKKGMGVL